MYFITSQMHPVLYHSVQSKAFHISPLQCEFLKITLSCLLCSTHLTWRENVWLNKSYRSHPPFLILPKSSPKMLCVCVCRWGRTWTDMYQGKHTETWWISGCGVLQTASKARCLQELLRSSTGPVAGRGMGLRMEWGWAGLPGPAQVYTEIYIHKYI